MAPLADAIVDERAMVVEPNSGLSHRLFDTHAALMALAGAPQHTIVTVTAVRSSWRSDNVTGLAEPASIKASGFNVEFLGHDMLKVRCIECGKHVYISVY